MNQSNTETEIIGYDGKYTIDKEGNVYSYAQTKKRKLKPQRASQSKKGYFQVRLHSKEVNVINSKGNQYGKLQYLHRLVWETYNGEIPEGMEIDHIDADTTNNKLSNLQLLTRRENLSKYTKRSYGIHVREHRDEIVEDYKKLGTYEKVAKKWGVDWNQIYRVIKDVYHYHNHKTKQWEIRRYNPHINDEFTDNDLRAKNKRGNGKKK